MIKDFLNHLASDPWYIIGFFGQFLFMMRFVIQWWHSERRRQSIIPLGFWLFSISGGTVLFCYALYKRDPVFIFGQGLGLIIYARNLYLIFKRSREKTRKENASLIISNLVSRYAENADLTADLLQLQQILKEKK